MLEQLGARGAAEEERRAETRRKAIADAVALPGVTAHVEGETVVLTGRGLSRRLTLNPNLRWQIMEARDDG